MTPSTTYKNLLLSCRPQRRPTFISLLRHLLGLPSQLLQTPVPPIMEQVWPLTQYSSVSSYLFKINDSLGKHYYRPFLLATPLSPSRTPEGLFELTQCPSRSLNSPHALLPELQRNKDTVRCVAICAKVPGHRQEQLTQTLI